MKRKMRIETTTFAACAGNKTNERSSKMKNVMVMTMLVAMVALMASSAQADTVGYWRFEDTPGLLQDSSNYDNDLTSNGNPVHYTLPATGAGAYFDDPIPQTSAANAKAVDLDGAGDNYTCADQTEFTVTKFTIEAYINCDVLSNRVIAGQYNISSQRSWAMIVHHVGAAPYTLKAYLSSDGVAATTPDSGLQIDVDKDYFVAMSFDLSNTTTGLKFYVKDLSAGTWETATMDHGMSTLHDSTGNFAIGGMDGGALAWDGYVDEVRFSDDALSQNNMLPVPEPATMVLLGLGGIGVLIRRRRRR